MSRPVLRRRRAAALPGGPPRARRRDRRWVEGPGSILRSSRRAAPVPRGRSGAVPRSRRHRARAGTRRGRSWCPGSSAFASSLPATATISKLAVRAEVADRRDAEADDLGDSLGDLLEAEPAVRAPVAPVHVAAGVPVPATRLMIHPDSLCVLVRPPCATRRSLRMRFGSMEPIAPRRLHPVAATYCRPGETGFSRTTSTPTTGTAGCLRCLRRLGPRRGRRQAHLLRPLRPAAPRPGVGRHRGQQRPPDPGLQGHGPGLPGLRRVDPGGAHGPPRHRALALLHHRRQHLAQRPADLPAHRRPARSRWPTTAT